MIIQYLQKLLIAFHKKNPNKLIVISLLVNTISLIALSIIVWPYNKHIKAAKWKCNQKGKDIVIYFYPYKSIFLFSLSLVKRFFINLNLLILHFIFIIYFKSFFIDQFVSFLPWFSNKLKDFLLILKASFSSLLKDVF